MRMWGVVIAHGGRPQIEQQLRSQIVHWHTLDEQRNVPIDPHKQRERNGVPPPPPTHIPTLTPIHSPRPYARIRSPSAHPHPLTHLVWLEQVVCLCRVALPQHVAVRRHKHTALKGDTHHLVRVPCERVGHLCPAQEVSVCGRVWIEQEKRRELLASVVRILRSEMATRVHAWKMPNLGRAGNDCPCMHRKECWKVQPIKARST